MKKVFFWLLFCVAIQAETIGVVGSGYVGLVLSGMLAKWGHQVICVDVDQGKIDSLKKGILPIYEPGLQELFQTNVLFTTELKALENVPLLFICVGTPPDAKGRCDLTAIAHVLDRIAEMPLTPRTVCIKSTVSPGSIASLEERLKNNQQIHLVYNPEFMREGSAIADLESRNPVVIGARFLEQGEPLKALYQPLIDGNPLIDVIETTPETAELIKYGWNGFSAIRVSYINELSRLCNIFSADIETVARGIAGSEIILPTKDLKPGCGYGGSCLPKDTLGLSRIFEDHGLFSTLAHQAIASNQQHLQGTIERLTQFIGEKPKEIAILGAAFKANTDDLRHAPALSIIQSLLDQGHTIRAYDPHALPLLQKFFPQIQCFNCPYEAAKATECLIVLNESTQIKNLDLAKIALLVGERKIADFKNLFPPAYAKEQGFELINVGRQQ